MIYTVIIYTYAIPSLAQRRASVPARIAYYAYWLGLAAQGGFGQLPMCVSCGLGTGNWCDSCENAGLTFTWGGNRMFGSALCTVCDDLIPCAVCGRA